MPLKTEQPIDVILSRSASEVFSHCHGLYDTYARSFGNRIVLFGAGFFGRKTLGLLRELGIEPLAFSDNNSELWGTEIDGLTVVSPQVAVEQFGSNAAFVVSIFHGTPIREQLRRAGCSSVVPCPYLYWKFPETFLPYGGISYPANTLDHADKVRAAFELWSDDQSRKVFLTQLEWRATMDYGVLPPASPTEETYFPPEIATVSKEVFVDCGGFDGDSIEAFFSSRFGTDSCAIAIEPDPRNCEALRKRMQRIARSESVTIYNVGAASEPGQLLFDSTGTAASTITSDGSSMIPCETLDSLLVDVVPTFIKMDIEGAELDALNGAVQTIKTHRPVLAICLYHKPADLWEIPLFVSSLGADYQYYLRAHSEECWELVLYAVPPERVRS